MDFAPGRASLAANQNQTGEMPMRLTWKIGDVRVTRVVEIDSIGGTRFILPQATREAVREIPWLAPHFADEDGRLKMSIHALVVETPARRIIVDTCIGNDKDREVPAWSRMQTRFLADLEEAGFAPDSIDTVLCTHLHVDHVGWNTKLMDGRWLPTFPKARYLIGKTEFDYWRDEASPGDPRIFADSVKPVWDAGLVDLVDTDHRICEEVSLMPTLGHTPGHVSVRIVSRGEEALITGDFIHHPCQMARPDWSSSFDFDPPMSARTRHDVFGRLAGTPTLVIGTHFAAPTAGRIVCDGDVYRFEV
jgi:glyoxylase-like metal-dependent hydrolase (beta-lactamase superfamily II)